MAALKISISCAIFDPFYDGFSFFLKIFWNIFEIVYNRSVSIGGTKYETKQNNRSMVKQQSRYDR